jgi:citrate synthase
VRNERLVPPALRIHALRHAHENGKRLLQIRDRANLDRIISADLVRIDVDVYQPCRGKAEREARAAVAVIYAELGFPPPLSRGLFCLSRSVGILAHAWEQTQQGGRNKGPLPRQFIWTYDGPPPRPVPDFPER